MKVFYVPQQAAANPDSFSPSADKPRQVVADWLKRGIIKPADLVTFDPVTRTDIALAHDRRFVDLILDLEIENGFGNTDPEVAATLAWTTGSMLAAARYCVQMSAFACSPTSGFHHARYASAGGFCTFNGLMVPALKLRSENLVQRVAIIDCDVHYGDGTADIIARTGSHWVSHHSMGRHFQDRQDVGQRADRFFQWLESAIEDAKRADLIIFQAGADPHIQDPLGGILTTPEMRRRDERVFEAAAGRPLVWNLAGGYQTDGSGSIAPVLRLHRQTAVACLLHESCEVR